MPNCEWAHKENCVCVPIFVEEQNKADERCICCIKILDCFYIFSHKLGFIVLGNSLAQSDDLQNLSHIMGHPVCHTF